MNNEFQFFYDFFEVFRVAWVTSRHTVTSLTVSLQSYIWQVTTEIPYWWRTVMTTKFWVVLLIGWKFASANQIQILATSGSCCSDIISWETVGDIVECCLFSQAIRHSTYDYKNVALNLFGSHQEPINWSEQPLHWAYAMALTENIYFLLCLS